MFPWCFMQSPELQLPFFYTTQLKFILLKSPKIPKLRQPNSVEILYLLWSVSSTQQFLHLLAVRFRRDQLFWTVLFSCSFPSRSYYSSSVILRMLVLLEVPSFYCIPQGQDSTHTHPMEIYFLTCLFVQTWSTALIHFSTRYKLQVSR